MIYLANIVRLVFSIYIILIFIRVLFAWIRPNMFNPLVKFVYSVTDPYLRIFANLKFLRIGYFDFSPIVAFYLLYLLQELTYRVLLTGYFSFNILISLIIVLLFRFVYFILFIFIAAVGVRLIFDIIKIRTNNVFITAVYTMAEPAIRPFRRLLKMDRGYGFDVSVVISLAVLILTRFLLLPKLLGVITLLLR